MIGIKFWKPPQARPGPEMRASRGLEGETENSNLDE